MLQAALLIMVVQFTAATYANTLNMTHLPNGSMVSIKDMDGSNAIDSDGESHVVSNTILVSKWGLNELGVSKAYYIPDSILFEKITVQSLGGSLAIYVALPLLFLGTFIALEHRHELTKTRSGTVIITISVLFYCLTLVALFANFV